MAYFECEGRKSINIEARSQTPAVQILRNVLGDRDIHILVWEKKQTCLAISGLKPHEVTELVRFLFENREKDINIHGDKHS